MSIIAQVDRFVDGDFESLVHRGWEPGTVLDHLAEHHAFDAELFGDLGDVAVMAQEEPFRSGPR
jgi:hypothetical protein